MSRALAASLRIELRDGVEDREARVSGAFGVVAMNLRPAEEGHHAVADKLRHVAVEACDRGGGGTMVAGDSLWPFLRIELSGDRTRADQIANSTVKRWRSPLGATVDSGFGGIGAGVSRGVAHCAQNLAWDGFSKPHFPQTRRNGLAH
jgi:hypothetical protein